MNSVAPLLVVDDNDISREVSTRVLAKTGLRVVTAVDGASALQSVAAETPALVLLDVVLPDMSGFDVLRQMRALPQMARVPIVFLSSERIRPEDQAAGLDAGSDGYITRPLANAELLARVRLHLRQGELAEDLHASEQRYRLLFESNPLPMHIFDRASLRILEVNAAALAHYGYTREEYLALTLADIRPPEDLPALKAALSKPDEGVRKAGVWRHLRKDGSIILVEITSHRLEWQGHDASLVLINDVTEREQASTARAAALEREREARAEADAARRHYQSLFEHAPGAYLVLTADTCSIVTVSDAFLEMTGKRRADLLGKRVFAALADDPANGEADGEQALRASFARVRDLGTTDILPLQRYLLKVSTADGEDVEARLRMASRAARFGGWSVDLPGKRISWSDEVRAILDVSAGYAPDLAEMVSYILSPYREPFAAALNGALENGAAFDLEVEVLSTRDRHLWVRVTGEAVRDDEGRISRVQGTLQDISARKSAELSVQESERRFRQLAEALPVFVWSATPEGRIDFASQRFAEYAGVESNQANLADPPNWVSFVHPDDSERGAHVWMECVAKEVPYSTEFRIRQGTDGSYRWFRSQAEPIRDASGKLIAWYGACIDIHENRALREDAERLSERFTRMLESITDAFCSLDREWCFTYVNCEFERVIGVNREDLLGRSCWEVFPDALGTRFEEAYRRSMKRNESTTFVEFSSRANALLEIRVFPTPDGLSIFFRDVTEIRKNEEQLRLLANAISGLNDIVIITTADDLDEPGPAIVFVNEAFERLTGYSSAEVLGRSPRLLQGEDTDPEVRRRIRAALATGEPIREEILNYGKNGKRYFLEVSIQPIRDEHGRLTHFVAIQRDVTAARAAEGALRTSEERLSLLARATSDAIWDWDPVSDRLDWSDGFEKLFGYDPRTVNPSFEFWRQAVHPDDLARALSHVARRLRLNEERSTHEYRFQRADGSYAYVRDHAVVHRDQSGRIVRIVGGMTDISETHAATERLHLLATALNAAADPVFIADRKGRLQWFNRAFTRAKGFTEDEALGRTMGQLVKSGKQDEAFYRRMWETILAGENWAEEMVNRRKDGTLVTELVSITPVRGDSGEVEHFIAIERDLTEDKLREQQFLRAQRMESIGTLAGGIAHDLNNVLSPIVMGVSLIRQLDESGKLHPIVDEIQRSAERGRDLVQQVLSFARGVEGQREPISIAMVVREIGNIVRTSFPKNILFAQHSPENLWTVVADPTQIHQVLLNLCVNSRDAMPEGGKLTISIENLRVDAQYASMFEKSKPGHYVVFEVADTGTGMDAATLERVFEPFFTTKELGKGTGLGLSTAAGIIRSHKGFMNVYSEVGKGTRFKVYLPALMERLTSPDELVFDVSPPRGRGECILVVDDEASILAMTKQTLEAFGYTVFTAENGTAAMATYATEREFIDLVLTDMMMPEMDGVALIRGLLRINPGVRIIAASGLRANGRVAKAADSGVKHFLPKPYSSDTMLRLVREVLDDGVAEA